MRIPLVLLLILLTATTTHAQKSENPYKGLPFKDRVFVGGNLGLSFGNQLTYIRIAPMLGYYINPRLSVGAGPSFQYWEDRRYSPSLESTIYGGSTFGRFFLLDEIFLQAEFELLNLEEINFNPLSDFNRGRVTIPVLFVGGGYSQKFAGGSGIFIAVMYDIIGDLNSPYPNDLVFRAGGFIGL